MKKIMAVAAGALLLVSGVAYAHEEHQPSKHHVDAQMAKLHKMMPRYAKTQVLIEQALKKEDLKAVAKHAGYILSTTADLKKSKPHKSAMDLGEFQGIAGDFERDMDSVTAAAKKGDLEGARAAFASAKERCNTCHAKFRAH